MPRPAGYPELPAFENEKFYQVQLWRTAEYAGRIFSPSNKVTVRGDVAKEIAERIYTAEETEPV